jgi:thiamine biosynthesis lipoprotein
MVAPAVAPAVARAPVSTDAVSVAAPLLGGRVSIHLVDDRPAEALASEASLVLRRIEAWAGRLTRFAATSELSRLNAAPATSVPIGPTLTAVLDWARTAEARTDGLVSVAFLDARLGAESGTASPPTPNRRWSLERRARGAAVRRPAGLRFDLDGVAKGWLADRALALPAARSALVDGDGDLAIRVAPGDGWAIGIADPRTAGGLLAVVRLEATDRTRVFGLATSGTSVHRWVHADGAVAHHLIDPRTGRPADTDMVQATVLAGTARDAEAFAKLALIAGTAGAAQALDRPVVLGAVLLTGAGEIHATPGMRRWLA